MGRPTADVGRGPDPRERAAPPAFWVAAAAGTLHAAASLYWALGGTWLLETLGTRIVDAFADLRWVLLPVAAIKLAGAWVPLELHRRGWPGARLWRSLCWSGAVVLVAWGGTNTVVGQLVLAGVVEPADGYDRAAMVGHAWLWDPLFLAWGVALASGLWLSRSTGPILDTGDGSEGGPLRADLRGRLPG